MNQDQRQVIDGKLHINGYPVYPCCKDPNPIVQGHIWNKSLFPVRGCSSCGYTHFLIGRLRLDLLIFLMEKIPGDHIDIKYPDIQNYYRDMFVEEYGEDIDDPINYQPLYKIIWCVIRHYFNKIFNAKSIRTP